MSNSEPQLGRSGVTQRLLRPAQVIIVSSVMFTFISYWRTAAVVLCDLASTAYYIGGIVETAIGPAAPWFILGVMIFSYAVRSVYIESCSLFVRGGVYRVVKEAMGGFLAKLSVSALMFDYILTGPISGVTAGQYIVGLILDSLTLFYDVKFTEADRIFYRNLGSVVLASLVTLYFFRQNLLGIHESSDKALKIVIATTIMAVIVMSWCGVTLAVNGSKNSVPLMPDLNAKANYAYDIKEGEGPTMQDPLGFISNTEIGDKLRSINGPGWLSLIGFLGIFIAFGHSILAMSGEETLAQVYREVESPKLPNFKKAAFIVFLYSLFLTATISFLAVMLIPNEQRMPIYNSNLISGLVMNLYGSKPALLILNAFVVIVGFLILSGAVNTAIIGSNGVLNRVAEDGVLPDWFLKPHPRYGTSYRLLWLIVGLQLFTIVVSRGDVILLGEAYAFGVVWSFVFKAMAMVVLRFRDRTPREYRVPLNVKIGKIELPIGLGLIFLVLFISAILNLLTKELATIWGLGFTAAFLTVFIITEHFHEKKRGQAKHEHLEQFNRGMTDEVTPEALGLTKKYRKLVAIRSPQNLFMLEKALAETDPDTTGVVVMTAKLEPTGDGAPANPTLDNYDQHLMTAVVDRAEKAGKQVKPLIVPTNNPLFAVLNTAKDLQAHELIMGASNKYTADEQLEQIAFYWISLHGGSPPPLTVRILSRDRDMYLDLGGGNRIPKISERRARNVAELRAAGVGVDRVLLVHDGSPGCSDLFQAVLTMLDPQVVLSIAPIVAPGQEPLNGHNLVHQDQERAKQLGRDLRMVQMTKDTGEEIVRQAREGQFDLIILPLSLEAAVGIGATFDDRNKYVLQHAHCRVFLATPPLIPQEVIDT
ncbi:MAG TPA: amino acid permease [Gemmataceae bacterium]|nr:amino acid permease [Gemmataceae bacterium]